MGSASAMRPPRTTSSEWRHYVSAFHEQRPGITEDVLAASSWKAQNPYDWLLELIPADASVLDIACGSAPMLRAGWTGRWVGVERSSRELDRARANGADPDQLLIADARQLPFDAHTFPVIVCSMGLMLLQPLDDCLAEMARVLAAGGSIVALIPGGARPLHPRDLWRWARILAALRRARIPFPNTRPMRRLHHTLQRHGLAIEGDDYRRFGYPIASHDAADRFIDSLYLPGEDPERVSAARRLAHGWVGSEVGMPLRRLRIRAQC